MMERIERKMKNLLLASIGAAAVTREQSEDLVHALVEKGEEVIDRRAKRSSTAAAFATSACASMTKRQKRAIPDSQRRMRGWNSCAICPRSSYRF